MCSLFRTIADMRVIAGKLGGQIFEAPKGHRTHPMSEKAKGALFSALGDIEGLSVLDTFSGSGALAIEAASRGATNVIAIDHDINAYKTIAANIKKLGVEEQCHAIKANANGWSNRHPNDTFDIVLCDPPYDDIQYKVIRKIARHVRKDGIFVLSLPGGHETLTLEGLEIVQNKDYGDAQLVFYKKIG